MFKRGAELIGLENPNAFSGNALWAYFLTHLYNSPDVSFVEAMGSARHNLISSSLTYIQRNQRSDSGIFCALYQTPATDTDYTVVSNDTMITIPCSFITTNQNIQTMPTNPMQPTHSMKTMLTNPYNRALHNSWFKE